MTDGENDNAMRERLWTEYIETCQANCTVTTHTENIRSVLTPKFCNCVDVVCVATYLDQRRNWDLMPIFISNQTRGLESNGIRELTRGVENLQRHMATIAIHSSDPKPLLAFVANVDQCVSCLKYW